MMKRTRYSFGGYLKDAGLVIADGTLSGLGLNDVVKDKAYTHLDTESIKANEALARVAGVGVATYFGGPIAGSAVAAGQKQMMQFAGDPKEQSAESMKYHGMADGITTMIGSMGKGSMSSSNMGNTLSKIGQGVGEAAVKSNNNYIENNTIQNTQSLPIIENNNIQPIQSGQLDFQQRYDTGLVSAELGGNLPTTGTNEFNRVSNINSGNTHSQNPLGGVPYGKSALVEEGEVVWTKPTTKEKYVFSNKLRFKS